MSDINIDDFCKDAARTLVALYSVFPRPITLFVSDIAGTFDADEFGIPHLRHQACCATFTWLGEEGFLRYQDQIGQEAIDQAVLSARAFTVLNLASTIDTHIDTQISSNSTGTSAQRGIQTYVHQLRQTLKAKDSEALKSQMLALISAVTNPPFH